MRRKRMLRLLRIDRCETDTRAVVGGHKNVEITVTVKVSVSQAASHFRFLKSTAHFGGDISKFSITGVEKQLRRLRVATLPRMLRTVSSMWAIGYRRDRRQAVEIHVQKSTAEAQRVF